MLFCRSLPSGSAYNNVSMILTSTLIIRPERSTIIWLLLAWTQNAWPDLHFWQKSRPMFELGFVWKCMCRLLQAENGWGSISLMPNISFVGSGKSNLVCWCQIGKWIDYYINQRSRNEMATTNDCALTNIIVNTQNCRRFQTYTHRTT